MTDWEVQKFRDVFKIKMLESYVVPSVLAIGYYLAAARLLRLYVDRKVFYRALKYVIAGNLTVMSYVFLNCYPWPCKQLHEIITQPEPNGKYIRTIIKENYPRHWSMMSKQLYEMGYNFKEMNEYSKNAYMPDITYKFDDSRY